MPHALESTIQRDYTAPDYKYVDDPFLIPTSNAAKRAFALSRESGRKAALWIRKEHAEWFDQKLAEPPIKAFTARPHITEVSEASEDILRNLIDEVSVTDAITIYEILEKKEQEISDETKLSFLELLSFQNCNDPVSEDLPEERWFRQTTHGKQKLRKTWKDGSLAEKVFETLSSGPLAGEAHRALIKGMARYGQAERAHQLFRNMTSSSDPKMAPDTGCYNAVMYLTPFLKEGYEARWQFMESLLREMAGRGLKPDLGTLNSILEVLSNMGSYRKAEDLAIQTLAEFHKLGIEPCLASYYYILLTFCKERGPRSNVLVNILDKLNCQALVAKDPKDVFFFVTAMEVCRHHLQDVDLAHRVHDLLTAHNNYDLIGDSHKESVYYRNYFILMCAMEPLETFMEFYNKLVPTVYIPEPVVMEEILKAIDLNGAIEYLPQMWSDIIIFDQTGRENLLTTLLDIMARNPVAIEDVEKNLQMKESYLKIAWGIWNVVEDEEKEGFRSRNIIWTGSMLGDLMTVCLQCGEFDKAWKVLKRLGADEGMSVVAEEYEPPPLISGIPSIKSLSLFMDACLKEGSVTRGIHPSLENVCHLVHLLEAQRDGSLKESGLYGGCGKTVKPNSAMSCVACVRYSAEAGFPEAGDLAQKLAESLSLNSSQMSQLTSAVGVLRTESPSQVDSSRIDLGKDSKPSES
ncbi:hypothetical protein J437_LFUL005922 [Ladona fulva]|uniref:Small ribosomal subunit protein mS39 n=1 Tax=Ladona fulva TaxID=123851 RepID=A0A8K0KBC1_LADFU|nr:hypothetical protein J437_LFUL005922 [Ladona fulva]